MISAINLSPKSGKNRNDFTLAPQTGLEPVTPSLRMTERCTISLADAKTLSLLPRMTPQIVNSKLRRMEGLPMTMNLFD
jgi:hypothetical protein